MHQSQSPSEPLFVCLFFCNLRRIWRRDRLPYRFSLPRRRSDTSVVSGWVVLPPAIVFANTVPIAQNELGKLCKRKRVYVGGGILRPFRQRRCTGLSQEQLLRGQEHDSFVVPESQDESGKVRVHCGVRSRSGLLRQPRSVISLISYRILDRLTQHRVNAFPSASPNF